MEWCGVGRVSKERWRGSGAETRLLRDDLRCAQSRAHLCALVALRGNFDDAFDLVAKSCERVLRHALGHARAHGLRAEKKGNKEVIL